ncbi:MAG TPA: MarR family transcriptional regulator [Burkholderiaceae bacterium]|nr:MarR family transcriptional regulator [Burkholderiaceae bacterium]
MARTPSDHLLLDQQLCFALYSSSLAMTKLYKPVLAPLGLTYPQYLVMLVLWEVDGAAATRRIGIGALGERLCLDSGTLTPLLKRMQAAGWLTRARADDDERRVEVALTPAGRALRRRAAGVPAQVACATGCRLDQIAALTAQLQALRDTVFGHLALAA